MSPDWQLLHALTASMDSAETLLADDVSERTRKMRFLMIAGSASLYP